METLLAALIIACSNQPVNAQAACQDRVVKCYIQYSDPGRVMTGTRLFIDKCAHLVHQPK